MRQGDLLEVFRNEQFILDFRLNGFRNLVAYGIVLFDEKVALVRLRKVPNVENGESFKEVIEGRPEVRDLVSVMQRAVSRIGIHPLLGQIDSPRIHNQLSVEIDVARRLLRQKEAERV